MAQALLSQKRSIWKLCVLVSFILITTVFQSLTLVSWKTSSGAIRARANKNESAANGDSISQAASTNTVTLFVRMGARVAELRRRFYCIFFRTSVLFWPASLGKTVLVFDKESTQDYIFAENVMRQARKYFPDRRYEVSYEPLPKDPNVLSDSRGRRGSGYNRQLFSSFFIDLYTNDSIIAWMDSDAGFFAPVTKSTIFSGTKLRVLGYDCTYNIHWVKQWVESTEVALGFPCVADFMIYFPVYIYRDTFTNCREYILKRFNTSNFEEAFQKLYTSYISPVIIILSYAWYFEKDRYDWNLQSCSNLKEYNKRFPANHTIGPEHIKQPLLEPQTAFHSHPLNKISPYIRGSYCLSHEAAGSESKKCADHSGSLRNNLVLFNHDSQRFNFQLRRAMVIVHLLVYKYSHAITTRLVLKLNKMGVEWTGAT